MTNEEMDRLSAQARKNNIERIDELVTLVNEILIEEGCETIDKTQIKFYMEFIGNFSVGETMDNKLSHIIFQYYYPTAQSGEYAHFTSIEALESILTNQKIRLTSMLKRKDEWEFKLFYEEHDITGYTRQHGGATYDEYLMSELFYLSLTKNQDSDTDIKRGMWGHFGKGGTGVKLVFDISTNHIDFRKVCYQNDRVQNGVALLQKLDAAIMARFNMPFVFESESKVGGFYISKIFNDEFETRYLIKKGSSNYPFPFQILQNENGIGYIELDFVSRWGNFTPVKIQPGLNCDRNRVLQIVQNSGLNIEVLPNAVSL